MPLHTSTTYIQLHFIVWKEEGVHTITIKDGSHGFDLHLEYFIQKEKGRSASASAFKPPTPPALPCPSAFAPPTPPAMPCPFEIAGSWCTNN